MANTVRIYFATNRDVKHETSKNAANFGDRFNKDGPQFFRVGSVEVTDGGGSPVDEDNWVAGQCNLYPEKLDPAKPKDVKIGSPKFFEDLREILVANAHDIVIYIHGFANDFQNTARRAAALQKLYSSAGAEQMVVMFSWPSNGNVFPAYEYFSDREDAELSGVAMARALEKFVKFLKELRDADRKTLREFQNLGEVPPATLLKQCERKIHIVAHSMGAYALGFAVTKFAELTGMQKLPRIFEHIFLMAADADADALSDSRKLARLVELANAVHVYHSKEDRALQISDKTKGNPQRLGADGPANFDQINERIFALDCVDVDDTILSHGRHQYYRLRSEVIVDVQATLAGTAADPRKWRVIKKAGRSWRIKNG
ncbi:MAG: alpha/beta hydrolase [Rhizobiaceae bacterium]